MKVQILTHHIYLSNISQHVSSKYKWSVKFSTFIATIYLKGRVHHDITEILLKLALND
jgi:hypothetical protein